MTIKKALKITAAALGLTALGYGTYRLGSATKRMMVAEALFGDYVIIQDVGYRIVGVFFNDEERIAESLILEKNGYNTTYHSVSLADLFAYNAMIELDNKTLGMVSIKKRMPIRDFAEGLQGLMRAIAEKRENTPDVVRERKDFEETFKYASKLYSSFVESHIDIDEPPADDEGDTGKRWYTRTKKAV